MTPRCPRCESQEVTEHRELLQGFEERFESTHECVKCKTRFRYTPPAMPAQEAA